MCVHSFTSNMGFMWANLMCVCIGIPIWDPHRLYVGFPQLWVCPCLSDISFILANHIWVCIYGFGFTHVCVSNMGFMWATCMWVCFGFAKVCPTWALYRLLPYMSLPMCVRHRVMWATHNMWVYIGLPIWDPHGLYVGYLYVGLRWFCPCVSDMGFIRANHIWVWIGLPVCVRYRLYVGCSFVGLYWVCPCVSNVFFFWRGGYPYEDLHWFFKPIKTPI